ncbi:unnamed protein product [Rhizoctonia solani]|uniref:GH16 domain-containing protein n=1 Tax=Rhizoctonia solani TaxID=456999 RepID=A0A8H3HEC8_9AGAM|nr:unnamed protein product [Rhizoctonia solani]
MSGTTAYNPVPTSPNSPTTPLDRPMNGGRTSTYVARSSPLNPNVDISASQRRSRPPSAGSAVLQPELQNVSRASSTTDGGDPRQTIAHLSYNPNTLYAPLRPPSTAVTNRFSTMSSTGSILSFASDSKYPAAYGQANLSGLDFVPGDEWAPLEDGPEDDDALHEPDPKGYKEKVVLSGRGLFNVGILLLVILALLALFISYPIVSFVHAGTFKVSTFVNATGQVAALTSFPSLIDKDTPQSAMKRTGFDGQEYELVFSDEFNTDGRTFYPGDDPFWEAVDLNYWATKDLEWYDPGNAVTKNGNLVITLESVLNHDLTYRSAMLQTWNKFCFTNGTSFPGLIDKDTPQSAMKRTGFDGQEYELVFSDEFNTDGRTFYPGDDPFWEAVDLNYWATKDLEWYDPGNVVTKDGNLVITLESVLNHDLNYRSGMLQSWNKFCFTNGYIEFNLSLPGQANVAGYVSAFFSIALGTILTGFFFSGQEWAWAMGNLGRPGYGGTTDGVWPYTYDSCDIGTFPNQTRKDGTPTTNAEGGTKKYNYQLSVLSGQKLSACTCPNTPSSEHPGPTMSRGRGSPEIDALEAQKNKQGDGGRVSQSAQFAPFSYNYTYDTSAVTVVDPSITFINDYRGSAVQQAVSGLTTLPEDIYAQAQGNFQTFGFEYYGNKDKRSDGYITWLANGKESFSMTAAAVGPDAMAEIQSRPIAEEPMSIVLNLAISESFQAVDVENMVFPSEFKVDYVRVYQRKGEKNVGCDPKDYPTAQYIKDHLDVYTNANITKWPYTFPKNSQYDGCD